MQNDHVGVNLPKLPKEWTRKMPKRRMTAKRAAQIKRFQLAGARKRRGVPTGKIMSLYHHTSPGASEKILKEGFKTGHKRRGNYPPETRVFASNRPGGANEGYGSNIVFFRVNRKAVKVDKYKGFNRLAKGQKNYSVDPKEIIKSSIKVRKSL